MMRLLAQAGKIFKPDDLTTLPQPPVASSDDVVTKVLQIIFGLAGAVALIIIMLGALKYVTSQGNPQATAKAKDTILYAVLGLVICILAFTIVKFVAGSL